MKRTTWYGYVVFGNNIPEARPGIYLVQNIKTGLSYIGISTNVCRRSRQHSPKGSNKSKLGRAIQAEGKENFLVCPLYYSIKGCIGLVQLERDLIAEYDSIENGYNIVASSSGVGYYGPLFSSIDRESHNTPEYRSKMKKINEITRNKRSVAMKKAWTRPETIAKMQTRRRPEITLQMRAALSERMTKQQNAPAASKRIAIQNSNRHRSRSYVKMWREKMTERNWTPERNLKIANFRTGGFWITDGSKSQFLPANSQIPEGWRKGRK